MSRFELVHENGTAKIRDEQGNLYPLDIGELTVDDDLTVAGTSVDLPDGSIDNDELANDSVTVDAGTGLDGGGEVDLGQSTTLTVEENGITETELDLSITPTWTGTHAFGDGLNLSNEKIENLAQPTEDDEAANKEYVDQQTGAEPGGDSGHVQYNDGDNFAGESDLFWDDTNKRLGIQTSSPDRSLDVDGMASFGDEVLIGPFQEDHLMLDTNSTATEGMLHFLRNADRIYSFALTEDDDLEITGGGDLEVGVDSSLYVNTSLRDSTASTGSDGDVLTATDTGVEWDESDKASFTGGDGINPTSIDDGDTISVDWDDGAGRYLEEGSSVLDFSGPAEWENDGDTDSNTASGTEASVLGGVDNTASGNRATVGGGQNNESSSREATISGGDDNEASEVRSTVGGGYKNTVDGSYAVVGGGRNNVISASYATIAGGAPADTLDPDETNNEVFDQYGTIGGGGNNQAGVDDGETNTAQYATVSGGEENTASDNHSSVSGGKSNTASDEFSTVGGGEDNEATGSDSTIGGGSGNEAPNSGSTVGGGWSNTGGGNRAVVAGGQSNNTAATYATIGGGFDNTANALSSLVSGGENNTASDEYATVGGGETNVSDGPHATIAGGELNEATSEYTTVGGGWDNDASGSRATIAGGDNNTAEDWNATVCGGRQNNARNNFSTIAGGLNNETTTDAYAGTVGGGEDNQAADNHATVAGGDTNHSYSIATTIGGGQSNQAGRSGASTGEYSTVGGGFDNQANDDYNTIGGGNNNQTGTDTDTAFGNFATVSGGQNNTAQNPNSTIGGGNANTASGSGATVPGGSNNTAGGDYSFAAGREATATHQGSFVFGDGTTTAVESESVEARFQMDITAEGNVELTEGTEELTIQGTGTDNEGLRYHGWGSDHNMVLGYVSGSPYYFQTSETARDISFRTPNDEELLYLDMGDEEIQCHGQVYADTDESAPPAVHIDNLSGDGDSTLDGLRFSYYWNGTERNWDINMTTLYLRFHYQDENVAYVDNSDGSWNTTSDRRLKENIRTAETVLDTVSQLDVVRYDFKRNNNGANQHIGFIGQDVESLFPTLAGKESEDGYYGVNYAGFSAVAIKAVQELTDHVERQQESIDSLEDENEALREQLTALERRVESLEAEFKV